MEGPSPSASGGGCQHLDVGFLASRNGKVEFLLVVVICSSSHRKLIHYSFRHTASESLSAQASKTPLISQPVGSDTRNRNCLLFLRCLIPKVPFLPRILTLLSCLFPFPAKVRLPPRFRPSLFPSALKESTATILVGTSQGMSETEKNKATKFEVISYSSPTSERFRPELFYTSSVFFKVSFFFSSCFLAKVVR